MLVIDNSNYCLCIDNGKYYYLSTNKELYKVTFKDENNSIISNANVYLNGNIKLTTNADGVATFYSSYDYPLRYFSKSTTSKSVSVPTGSTEFTVSVLCNSTVTMEVGIYCIGTIHWSDGTTTVKNRWSDGNAGSSSRFVTITKPVGTTFTVSAEYNWEYEGQVDVDDDYDVPSDKVFTLVKESYSIEVIKGADGGDGGA